MTRDSETLLPQPSILEKLKALDPAAPEIIVKKAEELGAARRAEEMKLVNRFSRAARTGWKDLLAAMIIYPGPYSFDLPSREKQDLYDQALARNASDGIAESFARVGDSLRLAIRAYMKDHNLTEDSLNLDEKERASMVLAFPEPVFTKKPAAKGFFGKNFLNW